MPEENFWTLWCKGRLTEADILTIQLGATPSGLTSAYLHHPPIFFTGRMPFLAPNQQHQSTEGSLSTTYLFKWGLSSTERRIKLSQKNQIHWRLIDSELSTASRLENTTYCNNTKLNFATKCHHQHSSSNKLLQAKQNQFNGFNLSWCMTDSKPGNISWVLVLGSQHKRSQRLKKGTGRARDSSRWCHEWHQITKYFARNTSKKSMREPSS